MIDWAFKILEVVVIIFLLKWVFNYFYYKGRERREKDEAQEILREEHEKLLKKYFR